jgi:hypothetical protein
MNGKSLIDSLPDIDSINKKYIVNQHIPPPESGMVQYTEPEPEYDSQSQQLPIQTQSQQLPVYDSNFSNLNCLDISKHVKQCPICQYYYNTNTLLYVNVIIGLFIIILLLKYYK